MLPPRIFLAREFPYLPIGAMGQLLVVDFHYTFCSEFDTHEGHDVHRTAEEAYTTVDMTAAHQKEGRRVARTTTIAARPMAARTADHHDDGQRDKGEHDADHSDDVTDTATHGEHVEPKDAVPPEKGHTPHTQDSKVSVQGTGRNETAAPRRPVRERKQTQHLGMVPNTRPRTPAVRQGGQKRKRDRNEVVYMDRAGAHSGALKLTIKVGRAMIRRIEAGGTPQGVT